MAWNKSGIEKITINFDLKKLIKELDSNDKFFIPPKTQTENYKKIAKKMKTNIKSGNFTANTYDVDWVTMTGGKRKNLKPSTEYVRNWRGNPTGPPLIETGRLLNSIKAKKDGIEMEDYGEYHLKGYKTKKNKFTTKFNMVGKKVPSRNFFHSFELEYSKKEKKEMINKINSTIKSPVKKMRK